MHRCFGDAQALLQLLLGDFHNQDAVFGGEADQGHQAHLGVDVQIDRAHRQECQGPKHGQGHGGQDDHRRDVALVLGGEHQVNDQHAEAEHQHAGVACRELKGREAGEGRADVGEVGCTEQLLDFCQSLAAALADRLSTLDQHGAVEVVVADHRRRTAQLRLGELSHLHQAPVAVAHVVTEHVVDGLALIRRALNIDVAHLAALVGESGIVAAGEGRDAVHRLLVVDVQRPHHIPIHR